jgi:NhaP-type Na+/H+ or K+/H+ antiporter
MTSGILDAFLDGFTGAGFWEKVSLPDLPTTYRQAMIALACGSIASLAVIGGFTYLVVHGYPKAASILISALVAGIIVRIVRQRRDHGSLRRETRDQE